MRFSQLRAWPGLHLDWNRACNKKKCALVPRRLGFEQLEHRTLLAVLTGAGAGGGPHVRVTEIPQGAELSSFFAYDAAFSGGVRVAGGDLNGDSTEDIITAAGPGGGPHVRVFDGRDGMEIQSFFAFPSTFTGGVSVAVGDINGDGRDDLVLGQASAGSRVRAFSGVDHSMLLDFEATPKRFGGVSLAAADLDRNGRAEIIVGAGAGGLPEVKVFDGLDGHLRHSFFAYELAFGGGVSVGAGDLTGDGFDEIVTGAGAGGGPHVRVFGGIDAIELMGFFAYDPLFGGGVNVAVGDADQDGSNEILTGAGPSGGPHVRAFAPHSLSLVADYFAYDPAFQGGVYVADLQAEPLESDVDFLVFVNPADSKLLEAQASSGVVVESFGRKDEQGFATGLDFVVVHDLNGDATTIFYDELGRPTEILAPNGTVLQHDWITNTSGVVTAISPDGSIQANFAFGAPSSTHLSVSSHAAGHASAILAPASLAAPALPAAISTITVEQCGHPTEEARVGLYADFPDDGKPAQFFPGVLAGSPGQYNVTLPTTPVSNAGQKAKDICDSLNAVIGLTCTAIEFISPALATQICLGIGIAIDLIAGGPTGEGVAIIEACEIGYAALKTACEVNSGGLPPGSPSATDVICNNIKEAVDRLVTGNVVLTPQVIVGSEVVTGSSQNWSGQGVPPAFSIEVPGDFEIGSFTTSPLDPAPGQGYTAAVEVICPAPNTVVNMSIVGTDGYQDSISETVSGDAVIRLFVPGAEADVRDVITVEIIDPSSGMVVDSRMIAILF